MLTQAQSSVSLVDCVLALSRGTAPDTYWDKTGSRSLQTRPHQRIYDVGDPADDVYLLLDGVLTVTTTDARVLLVLKAPALWGDIEFLAHQEERATGLLALDRARLLRFDAAALSRALGKAAFMRWHVQDLGARLHQLLLNGNDIPVLQERIAQLRGAFLERDLDAKTLAVMTGANVKAVQRALRQRQEPVPSTTLVYSMTSTAEPRKSRAR